MTPDGGMTDRPVRVLVVDDTRTVRMLIRALASRHPRIEVVGEAADPIEAGRKLKELNPDVMTLDVEMPRMNGLVFLEKVLKHRPLPVVMISSHTTANSDTAVKALALGAFECFDVRRLRPSDPAAKRLTEVLVTAGRCPRFRLRRDSAGRGASAVASDFQWNGRTVAIGSSTGGVETVIRVLSDFPANGPPVVIAQHMPSNFLESFARRLGSLIQPRVVLARDGQRIEQGMVLLGAGGAEHIAFGRHARDRLKAIPKQPNDLYSPSVDVLFHSAAQFGRRMVGVMLTGMGRDGAEGMLKMREAGGFTIAQSGKTAVVDGMPRAALEIGAVEIVKDLPDIGSAILTATSRQHRDGV